MLEPQVMRKKRPNTKVCTHCHVERTGENYVRSKVWFFLDGLAPVCNFCIKEKLIEVGWRWEVVDKLCQYLDIPFIPKEFERLRDINGDNVFPVYAQILQEEPYEEFGWTDYFDRFTELKELKLLNTELPEIHEAYIQQMRAEWGKNYTDDDDLMYLENLYKGMLATQTIAGALQDDQARKLCKISLSIDEAIRAGETFDKLMASYDRLVKTADFTPKNVKSENDFDSFGEVAAWLEKRGWLNEYFNNVNKDVVDEVIQNLQAFNQRLYVNESSIGEEITSRIDALKIAQDLESNYDIDNLDDFDDYDNVGYSDLHNDDFQLE